MLAQSTTNQSQQKSAICHPTEQLVTDTVTHCAEFLPAQGPITVFVHHNTLHAFEDRNFDQGVQDGGKLFGCHAYLPEADYRDKCDSGRIRLSDIDSVLLDDLGDDADRLIANFGTRHALRLAMLQFPFLSGSTSELRWIVAETDALRKFRKEVPAATAQRILEETKTWVIKHYKDAQHQPDFAEVFDDLSEAFDLRAVQRWDSGTSETFALNFLWRVCRSGVRQGVSDPPEDHSTTHSQFQTELLFAATGEDADQLVHEILIPFCAAYLDQGFADWELFSRDEGFFSSFLNLYGTPFSAPTPWQKTLQTEVRRLTEANVTPLGSIVESLELLGVAEDEFEAFITRSLLALRGWAGMIWQMETNAEWAIQPAPPGALIEFLAIRLMLDRLAISVTAKNAIHYKGTLAGIRKHLAATIRPVILNNQIQQTFCVFQLAQVRGWGPGELMHLSQQQWQLLLAEIASFSSVERRRIYHLAFERRYRNSALDAIVAHSSHLKSANGAGNESPTADQKAPAFQLVTCIDDREESFRRHIEEIRPDCETFGVAGFYGTAMYYRGATHAHYKPLCPVSIKPAHFVIEEPLYSLASVEGKRSEARRRIGKLNHQTHLGTRTFLGGLLTTLGGSLAAFPLVCRILFPRTAAQIRAGLRGIMETPQTQLRIERLDNQPTESNEQLGFSVEEMTDIVDGVLRAIGLTRNWSPVVFVLGHGSTSLNNPHASAYNCGACAGSQGGPNARAFALMANDPRVRRRLEQRNLLIPEGCWFVGGYHDTTNDSITFSDLDRLPVSHRSAFEHALESITEARQRNAHERCRRFASASLDISKENALRHVEDRPQDLSQARPEYNHATTAMCFVGRRAWHRGLFLDRRAFLNSYDPNQDDDRGTILEGTLKAAIPVCAGISLEYYFSTVDVEGYGCGSKLPHNITSLLGVMTGASSDLRPGLSAQMVEIHEPMRLLFVIETTQAIMRRIIAQNLNIKRLVEGEWVQLAVFDPAESTIQRYVAGEFVNYTPEKNVIPILESSMAWYRGQRGDMGFASIQEPDSMDAAAAGEAQ